MTTAEGNIPITSEQLVEFATVVRDLLPTRFMPETLGLSKEFEDLDSAALVRKAQYERGFNHFYLDEQDNFGVGSHTVRARVSGKKRRVTASLIKQRQRNWEVDLTTGSSRYDETDNLVRIITRRKQERVREYAGPLSLEEIVERVAVREETGANDFNQVRYSRIMRLLDPLDLSDRLFDADIYRMLLKALNETGKDPGE